MPPETVTVTVRFFAQIREAAGKDIVTWQVANGLPLAELIAQIDTEYPSVKGPRKNALIVVNAQEVADDYRIQNNDEIALLPPFSGG